MRYLFALPMLALVVSCSAPTTATTSSTITMAQYNQLATGMAYEAAVAIVGPGVEASRAESGGNSSVMYTWKNADGSNMLALFSNGKLASKSQYGLK